LVLGRLRRILVMTLAGVLAGGALLYTDARSGQAVQDGAPRQEQRAELKAGVKERTEIPSTDQLRASSGRGKALLYLLDRDEERIPLRRDGEVIRFQEVEREIHWAVITGVIDHQRVVQRSLIQDGGRLASPYKRFYQRAELQRQARREDGSWRDWETVDMHANLMILDNLVNVDVDRVPEPFRVPELVDPLPHLTQGKWTDVDVERFVPAGRNARGVRPATQSEPRTPEKERPPVLMVRSLDFTVEPGRTYRYRARVVLFNPHFNQGNPRDRNKLIFGPWSEVTDIVTISVP
jgi:hypothetical protein